MSGAIFFSGQYGATAQYAKWISDATGLPVFDIRETIADPADYDFVVIGSSVIVFKLTARKWISRRLTSLLDRPAIMFTVSGAPAGAKLNNWIASCLPSEFVMHADHIALRGRMDPKTLNWRDRLTLKIGAMMNKDPEARREEIEGFDYMDKASIDPVLRRIDDLQTTIPQAA